MTKMGKLYFATLKLIIQQNYYIFKTFNALFQPSGKEFFVINNRHQVNKAYLQQLNQIELSQLKLLTKADFLQKSFKYDNLNQVTRWMKIDNTFNSLDYDGIVYMPGTNKTYSTYQPPDDCPYKGSYNFDPRCRYYYQPTVGNISTVIFPPTMNLGTTGTYYASQFCQRRVNLGSQKQNEIFSVLCITLNLQVLPAYFQNFGNNSIYQMLIDPSSLTVLYNSQAQIQQQVTVMQTETDYLQDQSQANIFIQNLTQNSNNVILNTSSYQLAYLLDNSQQTFQYNRNGTDCLVILNVISIVDKVPKVERNRLNDPAPKFQLKKVYLFLDVLTKENLQIYATNLQNTIYFYNKIFVYTSYGLICIILQIQIYYSIILGKYILNPIIHLSYILSKIKIQNLNQTINFDQKEKITEKLQTSYVNSSQIVFNEMKTDSVNQIFIDEQIDADFEGLCHSRDTQDLLNNFQDMFKVLRFTTQNFYKEDASLQLLNLIKQIQHFQRFGNHRALGVCYNNMGVIHYNCGRFQEASENFQQAIIYANYELNTYSHHHQGEAVELSQNLKRITAHLRSSIQNNLSLEFTEDVSNLNISIQQEKQRQTKQYSQFQSYQVELYWSLFNRKTNLIKAMYMFIQNSNNKLWDIIEDYAFENIIISQIYLPPSNKREMINYYILSKVLQKQSLDNEAIQVLNRLSNFYVKIQESKYGKQSQENQKQTDVNSVQIINSQWKRELYSDNFINQSKNMQISNINQPNNIMSYNDDTNNSFILYSPIKKTKSMSKKINIQDKIKDKVQNLFKTQNNNFLNKLQINFQKIDKNLIQEKEPDQKVNQSKLKNSIYDSKKNKGIYNNQKKNVKDSNNKFLLGNDFCHHNISVANSKTNLYPFLFFQEGKEKSYDKITNQISQQPQNKYLADSQSQNEFHNILQKQRFSMLKSILSQQEVTKSSNQKSNKQIKFILKKKEKVKATALENNKFIFYPVRKHKNNDKVIQYEYSSDIYFQYCSIEHASYLIKQQHFYNAAVMLTSSFETCQYYLPHLRKIQMDMLFNIFQQQNIKSKDFEIANKRYSQMTSSNFNIYLISACQKQSVQLKLYAICNDLVNEILFKENDYFGLIQYSYEEQIFTQLIASTQVKLIQQAPLFFEQILLSLLPKKQANHTQKLKNDKIQLQQKKTLGYPQSTSNLPSLNQISVFQDINQQSFQNSNLNLKTGSILKSDNYHFNKKAQNQKSDQESFDAREDISSFHLKQKLNFARNEFLEQIDLNTSQTSIESYTIPNQIQFFQTKENIKQHNLTKMLTQKYFQTISSLNTTLTIKNNSQKQLPQPQSINNSNIPFKEDYMQQIYTFMDDKFKEDSINIKNLSKKNGQNTQNNSNNSNYYNIQLQKSDSEKTQNLMNLEKQEQQITGLDQLKNQQAIQCQFNTSPKSSQYKNRQQSIDQAQKKVNMQYQKSFLPNQIQIFNASNQKQQPISDNTFQMDLFMFNSSPTSKQTSPLNQFQHLHDDQNKSYQLKSYENQFVDQKVSQNRKYHEMKKQQCKSSEYLFHLGVHACLKQFILNSDEKLSIHLTQNKYKHQSNKKYEPQKNQQAYLIYITDQYFQITKSNLMQELTQLLISIGTELLILVLNDVQQLDESSGLENVSIDGKQIISFFNSEQKMLQYIYNTREHLKNYLMPMVIEHF
ncbi:YLP motif protein (macronuclear) [Tetrahymena thermophila SB210]|uniref:YLP motif protein n=1 Tax=Tetrahymena thermophila (strain SB210) TaxID=312017 RepID=W7XLD7_TETTS|nr:YLP motif protein [Tetrahymena thermophila SB210]EWS76109.1 YLP motif protein [Tetrahymena thermophila SB210]|eukprot:XP_012651349.1 YLP motif protein [Tetrahymena thermophila SB210]